MLFQKLDGINPPLEDYVLEVLDSGDVPPAKFKKIIIDDFLDRKRIIVLHEVLLDSTDAVVSVIDLNDNNSVDTIDKDTSFG